MSIELAIVGAGAAGTLAAIEAASRGARVNLYDTNARVGRKLLITGNGRCNLSNHRAAAERYTCADPQALATALQAFGVDQTLALFGELGIPTYATADGWCYPRSDSAAAVADILAARLDELGVQVRLQTKVADLRPHGAGWALALGGPEKWVPADRVIVACGGAAYPALGSKGELWPVLERLGHSMAPARPALAPIVADVRHLQPLQGVRLDVTSSLWLGGAVLACTRGNIMFTQYGFSGPAAMDLAHLVPRHPAQALTLQLDLLDGQRDLLRALAEARPAAPLSLALAGLLPLKLAQALPGLHGLSGEARASVLLDGDLLADIGLLRLQAKGTRDLKEAQLSSGGVPLTEIEPLTMASLRAPGLYACGEVLDVVGPCGGYNLQWAWTSGVLAGRAAAGG